MAPNAQASEGEVELPTSICCIYCKATIYFPGLPAKRYMTHLFSEHNIMHEVEKVIQWTLQQQIPSLADPVNCSCKASFPKDLDQSKSPKSKNKETQQPVILNDAFNSTGDVISSESYLTWSKGKCVYQCSVCQLVIYDSKQFFKHISSAHEMNKKMYYSRFADPCIVEVKMTCRICDQSLRHDLITMTKHMDEIHRFELADYYRKFHSNGAPIPTKVLTNTKIEPKGSDYDQSIIVPFLQSTSSKGQSQPSAAAEGDDEIEFMGTFESMAPTTPKVIRISKIKCEIKEEENIDVTEHIQSNFKEEATIYEPTVEIETFSEIGDNEVSGFQTSSYKVPWYCGMLYECNLCQCQAFELGELKKHLATVHEESNVENDAVSIVSNFHECLVCGKGMIHCYSTIRGHLNNHDLSLSLYFEQFKEDLDREPIHLPITDLNLIAKLNGKRSTNSTQSAQELRNQGQGSNQSSNGWLNRCGYSCQLCSFEANNHSTFRGHIQSVHQLSGKDYASTFGQFVTSVVKHTCQICGGIFNWDRNLISKHLTRLHNSVSIGDYVAAYENRYTDTPVLEENSEDQWMNKCVFECKECDQPTQMNTRSKLILHLSATHQLELKKYVEKHKTLFSATSSFNHVCKVCEKKVRWDRDSIVAHLDRFHGLTSVEYYNQYITEEDLNQTIFSTKNTSTISYDASSNVCPSLNWNDKCSFACQICYQVCKSKNLLKWHLQSQHCMKENYYSDHFESEIVDKVTHSCMICQEEILFDSTIMKKHLQSSHNKMPIEVYKADYLDKYNLSSNCQPAFSDWINNCQYYCKLCPTLHIGKEQFRKHLSSDHSLTMSSYTESHKTTIYAERNHFCQVPDKERKPCLKPIVWDSRSLTYHLSKHNLSPDEYSAQHMINYHESFEAVALRDKSQWADKCTFLCRICSKEFNSKQAISLHLTDEHQTLTPDVTALKDMAVNFVLHSCQICSDNIMWEEQSVTQHFKSKHSGLSLQDYATQHLPDYHQNEACDQEIQTFDSWVNQCVLKCMCCTQEVMFDKKSKLVNHLSTFHKDQRSGYFITHENETFIKKTEHVCQVCMKIYIWDEFSLHKHIARSHKMSLAVYRAKYMSRYTENEKEIEHQRKEDSKQSRSAKQKKTTKNESLQNDSLTEDRSIDLNDDEVWGSSDEVRTWARGCVYHCDVCSQDFVGARPFDRHLAASHGTSMSSSKKKYSSNQVCTVRRFHFCRLCFNNVRQDEDDLKNHFQKEHNISVAFYYEQFKPKLTMPRLERPVTTRADISALNGSNKDPVQAMGKKRSPGPAEGGSSEKKPLLKIKKHLNISEARSDFQDDESSSSYK